ncbi:MAG: hypothetical protein K2M30_05460 [Desulfovibrionaceae bacterium]|nr:hypothetical protein [Desulfovibrionaceae bacterium]
MEAKQFTCTIGCKINIGLHVGKLLPNGYHEVNTLLYPIPNPYDTLHIIEHEKKKSFSIECEMYRDLEKENILHNTYEAIMKYCKKNSISLPFSYSLVLHKGIPMGAGLGGGSADAGTFLSYFSQRFGELFPYSVLDDIAKSLGADVPFFLYNKPAYAEGIGSILYETDFSLQGLYCLIAELPHTINTATAYKELDIFRKNNKKNLTGKNKYSKRYSRLALMVNDFEEMLFQSYPDMKQCKEYFILNGAVLAGVSGSGSSMFGIFRTKKERSDAELSVQNIVKALYLSDL